MAPLIKIHVIFSTNVYAIPVKILQRFSKAAFWDFERNILETISRADFSLHLSMRKLFVKRVPRLLTMDQNQQLVGDSVSYLVLFRRIIQLFFVQYVTITFRNKISRELSGQQSANATDSWESYDVQILG